MLFFGNSKDVFCDLKSKLSRQFDMKDLGVAKYILGMENKRERENRNLRLSQCKYVNSMLQPFSYDILQTNECSNFYGN